jgi:RimJ/RimL family protein N-acetyltransferase
MDIQPVVLEGRRARLEPLTRDHRAALSAVGFEGNIFQWFPTPVVDDAGMLAFIELALEGQRQGSVLPFATVDRKSGAVVGSTRFAAIDRAHKRAEIGWTWIARPWQRSGINVESKYLLLRHAFEVWGMIRVEFKTDRLNVQSRTALARIGAREEGTFRNHMITSTGRVRDSVWYSIIDREWPAVKAGLARLIAAGA